MQKFKSIFEPPFSFLYKTDILNLPHILTTDFHRVMHRVSRKNSIRYDCILKYPSVLIAGQGYPLSSSVQHRVTLWLKDFNYNNIRIERTYR